MVNEMTVSSSHGDSSRDLIFQVNDEKSILIGIVIRDCPYSSIEHLISKLSFKLCKYDGNSSMK